MNNYNQHFQIFFSLLGQQNVNHPILVLVLLVDIHERN